MAAEKFAVAVPTDAPPPFAQISWNGRTWDLARRLGHGKFAVVHEAKCRDLPHKRVAAKIINKQAISAWGEAQLTTEIDVWKSLDHPHICKLYGSVTEGSYVILFLELATGGELFERILERSTFLEKDASRLIGQLLSAVAYLHERGVIHRDLKPENLLLDSMDDNASLRIADFGAAKLLSGLVSADSPALASTPCGSLGYAAPEQIRQQLYERQCDLWSAGVIAYVLLSGAHRTASARARTHARTHARFAAAVAAHGRRAKSSRAAPSRRAP